MKNSKDQGESDLPGAKPLTSSHPGDRVTGDTRNQTLDSSLHEPDAPAADLADSLATDDLDGVDLELHECLELIGRVKQHSPEVLEDWVSAPDADLPRGWELPSQRLGRFEIKSLLGQGGFGIVYEAVDTELGRSVALKVPRMESLLRESDRNRFLREAQAMCRVNHPNLVTILEAGNEGPIYYIASQFCGGGTLADYFAQHVRCSQTRAAELLRALAGAVQHAHSRGILHRDIKPTNVLFDRAEPQAGSSLESDVTSAEFPEASQARLADFGLAKILDADPRQTQTGALLGTPSYMSPEQAESRTDEIGAAADVYALGAILYELLSGRPPFQRDTLVATLDAVRDEEPIAPTKLDPTIAPDLEAVCLKCLQKKPADRYPTAQALAEDLERWLSGHSVTARRPTGWERLSRWCRRNPAWTLLAATILVALLASTWVSTAAYYRVDEANRALVQSNTQLQASEARETRRTSQLRESLDAQVSVVLEDILLRSFELTDAHREYLSQTIQAYETFLDDQAGQRADHISAARALVRVGEIRGRLGEEDLAIQAYRSAIERYQALLENDSSDAELLWELARAKGSLGNLHKQRQELDKARPFLLAAQADSQRLLNQHPRQGEYLRTLLEQQASLANVERAAGKADEAKRILQSALDRATEELDSSDPENAFLLSRLQGSLAQFLFPERAFARIETLLVRANEIDKRLIREHAEKLQYVDDLADNLNMLGYLYLSTGRADLAVETLGELIRTREELTNRFPAHPEFLSDYVVALNNFGSVLMQGGKSEQAEEIWTRGYEAAQRLVSRNPDVPYSRAQLAALAFHLAQRRLDQGNLEAAQAYAEQGELELRPVMQANAEHPQFRQIAGEQHVVLARLYSAQDLHEQALVEIKWLQQHPFHPVQTPLLAAKVVGKAAVAAANKGDSGRAAELKAQVRESILNASRNGFRQWQDLESDAALGQLFSEDEFAALRQAQ